jgi:WD40 repeat protein
LKTIAAHSGEVTCLENLLKNFITSCSIDKTIKIWDIETGDYSKILEGHTEQVSCLKLYLLLNK